MTGCIKKDVGDNTSIGAQWWARTPTTWGINANTLTPSVTIAVINYELKLSAFDFNEPYKQHRLIGHRYCKPVEPWPANNNTAEW